MHHVEITVIIKVDYNGFITIFCCIWDNEIIVTFTIVGRLHYQMKWNNE